MENVKTEKMSAQTFMQRLLSLNQSRYQVSEGKTQYQGDVQRLEKVIREQVDLWGGKDAIDSWLKDNDPSHDRPNGEGLKNFDWSFLDRK